MSDTPTIEPWKTLKELIEQGDSAAARDFLKSLPHGETTYAIARQEEDDRDRLLTLLGPEDAADLIEQLPEPQAAEIIEHMPVDQAADIVDELPSDEQADLLRQIPQDDAEAIIAAMEPEEARDARALRKYPDDAAGGLMITEFLAYPATLTVGQVVDDLRQNADKYRDYAVQYLYVTKPDKTLVGLTGPRDLLLADRNQTLGALMIHKPLTIEDSAPLVDLEAFFDRHQYLGAPVVDAQQRLVGIVQRSDVEAALAGRGDSDYRKSQGIVGGEELRSMPMLLRSRRRLSWLSVNILLNVLAASVIAIYQDTVQAVIALAVFLPIISDMSGCCGSQAIAVSMRELAMGLARPADVWRVWAKEVTVGLFNGLTLGVIVAGVAWLWKGNWMLGLVVGGALALNSVVAVSVGGTMPLILKRLKVDPALASGPILTTVTDICGFFFVLSFATLALPWIQ